MVFSWTREACDHCLRILGDYKSLCESRNDNWDGDRSKQLSYVHAELARIYENSHPDWFGVPDVATFAVDDNEDQKVRKVLLAKVKREAQQGYCRVRTQVKRLRQGFIRAGINGTNIENYEPLRRLYGGDLFMRFCPPIDLPPYPLCNI